MKEQGKINPGRGQSQAKQTCDGIPMSEEGAPGAVDGVEAVDEVEGRVQGNLERPPAQLHGCGRMTSRT